MNKKGLLIGPKFFHYNLSVINAFNHLGWNVELFEYDEPVHPSSLLNRVLAKLTFGLFKRFNHKKLNKKMIAKYRAINPDFVLFIKGSVVSKQVLEQMTECKKLLWMMDSIFSCKNALNNIKLFDHVFCFEKSDVEQLKGLNTPVSFLPLAVDANLFYKPKVNSEKTIDLLFIGAISYQRYLLMKELIEECPDLRVLVVGPLIGLQLKIKYILNGLPKNFRIEKIMADEVRRLYWHSRFVLNVHHEQSKYGVNPRFFEIIASGANQIVDQKPFLDDFFPGYKFLTYRTKDDLVELLKVIGTQFLEGHYSEDLHSEIIKFHTFENRVKEILLICSS